MHALPSLREGHVSEPHFRLVTRSDFDGLVCGVLLKELNLIEEITFVHPKDMQDGRSPSPIVTLPPISHICRVAIWRSIIIRVKSRGPEILRQTTT
jgi:hypothetical protein